MSNVGPLRGPQGGDPSKIRAEIVKDAATETVRQVKPHIKTMFGKELPEMEQRLFDSLLLKLSEKNAAEVYEKGHAAGVALGAQKTKASRTWAYMGIAWAAMLFGALGTAAMYERQTQTNVLTGVAIGRGEANNAELKALEDAQ